jgi:hypothetical protein
MIRIALTASFVLVLLLVGGGILGNSDVWADECPRGSLRANILSQGSGAVLSLKQRTYQCRPPSVSRANVTPGPSYVYEVLCDPSSQQGPGTLCSVAPCLQTNQAFALRNLRFPGGRGEPAGSACLNPGQDPIVPGVTLSQIAAAIRKIRLPDGKIGVTPATQGLVNLKSYFWVEGVSQTPVQLSVGGSILRAEFRVVEYQWMFGRSETLVTQGPGTPDLESEVNTTFRRRGVYRVGVTVVWVAEAYLDGRRVGEVDDLVSGAETTYPVAELRTVLTG